MLPTLGADEGAGPLAHRYSLEGAPRSHKAQDGAPAPVGEVGSGDREPASGVRAAGQTRPAKAESPFQSEQRTPVVSSNLRRWSYIEA